MLKNNKNQNVFITISVLDGYEYVLWGGKGEWGSKELGFKLSRWFKLLFCCFLREQLTDSVSGSAVRFGFPKKSSSVVKCLLL